MAPSPRLETQEIKLFRQGAARHVEPRRIVQPQLDRTTCVPGSSWGHRHSYDRLEVPDSEERDTRCREEERHDSESHGPPGTWTPRETSGHREVEVDGCEQQGDGAQGPGDKYPKSAPRSEHGGDKKNEFKDGACEGD